LQTGVRIMGRRRKGELPRYRLHRQSGQAVVSFPLGAGRYRDVLLGLYDSEESKREYAPSSPNGWHTARLSSSSSAPRLPTTCLSAN
jgi:hypothetical protein